jgi:MscS family membrane protein
MSSHRRIVRRGLVAAACLLVAVGNATATPTSTLPIVEGDIGFTSPRSTMRGFLAAAREGEWDAAARHLDLRDVPRSERAELGPRLARDLKTVLDRTVRLELDDLSADPAGRADDGQPKDRDVVGTVDTTEGPVRLYVQRRPGADGSLEWRIAAITVSKIERLHEEFGSKPALADWLPPVFFHVTFLDTALWQWTGILVLALAAALVALAFGATLIAIARFTTRRTADRLDDIVTEMAVGPVRLVLAALLFSGGLYALWLPVVVHQFFAGFAKGILAIGFTWFAIRLVGVAARRIQIRMAERGDRAGISAVPLVRRVVNALIVLLAGVVVISALGVNVTGIVAGLGVGGLAVALAAQKSLENLFGGLTLIVDQPVRVGDFCRFGDQLGTIEDIGLRSTRIRTLNRTIVTVPNAELATMQIENFARRDRIWLQTTIGVRYETSPDQLRYLLVELKKMLLGHPKVDPDPARVRFNGFGAYSLDVAIFAYVRTTDINEFLAVQEDIFLRIMEIVAASGTGFAFPSQTVYTMPDEGLDAQRTKHAEEVVADWRAKGRLYLPTIPQAEVETLSDRLSYPPEGAPDAPKPRPRSPSDE